MSKQKMFLKSSVMALGFLYAGHLAAQNLGQIHGNFQVDAQYYNPDTAIGAPPVPEKMLSNGFANINYNYSDKFYAGIRYESYLNVMQGFDSRYKGTGIPYRYASYKAEQLEVTVGNFYEQFGNGLVLRAYEERGLLYDNAMDGIRLKFNPAKGVYLKGLIGKQRSFFDQGPGIVRGFDGELNLNEMFAKPEGPSSASDEASEDNKKKKKTYVRLGGSFVSKYQADQDPLYVLPENVGSAAGRINISRGNVIFGGEYAYKINDPSTDNGLIFKPGEALLLNASYTVKGFSLSLAANRYDNMSFRSDRSATIANLLINYLPALNKQHTYTLVTFYPYAVQPVGEMGFSAELYYKIKKGTPLGGKYGTEITINYSGSNSIDKTDLNDTDPSDTLSNRLGYTSDFLKIGEEIYFRDFFIQVSRKFNKKFKSTFMFSNQVYNMNVIQGLAGHDVVFSNIGVLEMSYKYQKKRVLRTELQALVSEQELRNWVLALVEHSWGSKWFLAVQDQYNNNNVDPEARIHYFTVQGGYMKGANRITLTYGRQRAGIFCVGGVCRNVPASNGLTLTVVSSF